MSHQINNPHIPSELRIQIIRSYISYDYPITAEAHTQIFEQKLLPLIQSLGESWSEEVLNQYYNSNVFRMEAPPFWSRQELAVPSFAGRVRNLEFVIPFLENHDVRSSARAFTRHRGTLLQYLFKLQQPISSAIQRSMGFSVPLQNPLAPPINTDWYTQFTNLGNLKITFKKIPGVLNAQDSNEYDLMGCAWTMKLHNLHFSLVAPDFPESVTVSFEINESHRSDYVRQVLQQTQNDFADVILDIFSRSEVVIPTQSGVPET
ncbi:unnamed protein product [Periconia digitata]|uniref:TIGR04255 family protein n=1 Tax=Periconia digitata TaxID=1303443 RepID=A0A9W4XXP2_9PLEO|nr:unnamed protein product [Periconia digitata]